MTGRPIRTTVSVVFQPPDTLTASPLRHYRQEMQANVHRLLMQALAGCKVLELDVVAEYVPE